MVFDRLLAMDNIFLLFSLTSKPNGEYKIFYARYTRGYVIGRDKTFINYYNLLDGNKNHKLSGARHNDVLNETDKIRPF